MSDNAENSFDARSNVEAVLPVVERAVGVADVGQLA